MDSTRIPPTQTDIPWSSSPHWGTFWGQFQIELLGGTLSALIFLFLVLWLFKPKIKISPFICKGKSRFDDTDLSYFIKFVNMSLFSAYEIKFELNLLERYAVPPSGMMNIRTKPLTVVQSHLSAINAFRPTWLRKEASHAFRIRTIENISEILENDFKSIQIQITLKHGLTGLTKVYAQEYSDVSQVKSGNFTYGTTFAVLQ